MGTEGTTLAVSSPHDLRPERRTNAAVRLAAQIAHQTPQHPQQSQARDARELRPRTASSSPFLPLLQTVLLLAHGNKRPERLGLLSAHSHQDTASALASAAHLSSASTESEPGIGVDRTVGHVVRREGHSAERSTPTPININTR
ncbi:hypothetical protein H4582DRAFT_2060511 [Lactarius indigo]|nr:hypothetical protein H4582DRAFT_2060511 [Lactarius indigo]